MIMIKAVAVLAINFILYAAFGSFFEIRRQKQWSLAITVAVGFFAYYALFALFCLPVMLTYRPLSLLARIWILPCIVIPAVSIVLYRKEWIRKFCDIRKDICDSPFFWAVVFAVTAVSLICVTATYNFTLDAAYYVAGVATNVHTDMINVYDPFTGGWLDHFELRYVFATYYANDAVVCSLTGLPALVQTKGVMSAVVMIMVNMIYVHVSRTMFAEKARSALMYVLMTAVNFLFISLYTTSDFLMTRTYEGKSVVGNISVLLVFILYMRIIREDMINRDLLLLFVVCLGTATVSSTANMVIPAEVGILFIPYAISRRRMGVLAKALLCVLPEIFMMAVYVLYVKGYFAVYTFPR